ncbi:ribosomal protein S16, partial [Rozella allomycis CSF55]
VRIRMQQLGSTKARFYRIVVAPKEAKRNGKFIEELGSYEPYPDSEKRKYVLLDFTRIKYWLGNGAQPMGLVRKLLGKV